MNYIPHYAICNSLPSHFKKLVDHAIAQLLPVQKSIQCGDQATVILFLNA